MKNFQRKRFIALMLTLCMLLVLFPASVFAEGGSVTSAASTIAAGWRFSYFVTTDGDVYAAGKGGEGELGNNGSSDSSTPVKVILPDGFFAVAAAGSGNHGLFLSSDGKVYATGNQISGKLGNNVAANSNIRTPIPVAFPDGVFITAVETVPGDGVHHNLFLTSDGKVYGGSLNSGGQLGLGNTTNRLTPVLIDALGDYVITGIDAGGQHSLFLTSDGRVFASGYNNYGQLGDNTTTQRTSPVAVDLSDLPEGVTVTAVSAGYNHSLFLGSNGKIYAAGDNRYGQLGIGSTTPNSSKNLIEADISTVTASGAYVTAVVAEGNSSFLLASDGAVYAFGANTSGQLGDGSTTQRNSPVKVLLPDEVICTSIASGADHTLFLTSTGTVYSTGAGANGRLANGSTANKSTPALISQSGFTVAQPSGKTLEPISLAAVGGVTAPVAGAAPVTTITETAQYTGTVTWTKADGTVFGGSFGYETSYKARITLIPKPGYGYLGIMANFFTVEGAVATNGVNSGVITAVFAATGEEPSYAVAVIGGIGGGSYKAGVTVTAAANAPDVGELFQEWSISPAVSYTDGTDKTSQTVKFIMPASAVTLAAVYHNCGHEGGLNGTWTVTQPATCSATGVEAQTCGVCSSPQTRIIPINANAHNFGAWMEKTAATCDNPKVEERVCAHNAAHEESRSVGSALGHDYQGIIITPATCTNTGVKTFTCSHDSGHTYMETLPINPDAHSFGAWTEKTPADCDNPKVEERICAHNSAHKETRNVGDALGHDHQSVVTPPTCTQAGFTTHTCSHNASHTFTDAPVDALGHIWSDWMVTTPAKINIAGEETRRCSVCDMTETRTIPALDGSFDFRWDQGNSSYEKGSGEALQLIADKAFELFVSVSVNGQALDLSHYTATSGSTIITLKQSYLDTLPAGTYTLTALFSDNTSAKDTFTVTAKDIASPQTGDSRNPLPWVGMMIGSLGILTALILRRKRRQES